MENLRLNFNKKIALTCFLILTLLSTALSAGNYFVATQALNFYGKSFLENTVEELYSSIELQSNSLQKLLNSEIHILLADISQNGGLWVDQNTRNTIYVTNQNNLRSEKIEIPRLMVGNSTALKNYSLVDKIKSRSGAFATIFQVLPGKLLRVSTNIVKSNGERATGTYIPSSSPVYKTVMSGRPFYGRATVVGEELLTAYTPVRNNSGKIVAVVFTGVQVISKELEKMLAEVNLSGHGYAFVYNSDGDVLIHPTVSGANLSKKSPSIWNKLKNTKDNFISYEYEGGQRNCYIKYFEPWDWM